MIQSNSKCYLFIEKKRSFEYAVLGLQIFQIYYENYPFHNHQNRLFGHRHSYMPKQFEIQDQNQFPCLSTLLSPNNK